MTSDLDHQLAAKLGLSPEAFELFMAELGSNPDRLTDRELEAAAGMGITPACYLKNKREIRERKEAWAAKLAGMVTKHDARIQSAAAIGSLADPEE